MRMRARQQGPADHGIDSALLAELHLLEAAIGGQSILDYIPRASPVMPGGVQGISPRHLKVIADQIALAEYGPQRIAISVPPRHGKQLADSTPVLTPDGWRTHGELAIGDRVYAVDGTPCRVTGRHGGLVCGLELVTSDGEVVTAHAEHLWTVVDRGSGSKPTRVMTTAELAAAGLKIGDTPTGKRGSRWRFHLPNTGALAGADTKLPFEPYFLGLWLGDGSSDSSKISMAASDAVDCMGLLEDRGHRLGAWWRHPTTSVISWVVRRTDVGRYFRGRKHVPDAYLTASVAQRRELLRGLVDSDGSVEPGTGRVRFVGVDRVLVEQVALLARTLGYRAHVHRQDPTPTSRGIRGTRPVYTAQWTPHDGERQAWLARKDHRAPVCTQRMRSVVAIRPAARPEVGHCIAVDHPSHTYLVGRHLVPTHNTELILHAIAWYLARHPEHTVAYASYSADIAGGKSVRARDLAVASDIRLRYDQARASEWRTVSGGGLLATGVGGPLTGQGCFVAGTKVSVPGGVRAIEAIRVGDEVIGFDGAPRKKRVLAVRELERHVVKVTTASGRVVVCTDDHPFYVRGVGYIPAGELVGLGGRGLGAAGVDSPWPTQPGRTPATQGKRAVDLPAVWDAGRDIFRGVEASEVQGDELVLLHHVQDEGSAAEPTPDDLAHLRPVRTGDHGQGEALPARAEASGVLRGGVQDHGLAGAMGPVRALSRSVQDRQQTSPLLLGRLQERCAQLTHARRRELALQDGHQLCEAVQGHGTGGSGSGQMGVPGVLRSTAGGHVSQIGRSAVEALVTGAPRGSCPVAQHSGEPDHAVPVVPCDPPQVGRDTVATVERLGGGAHRVYDIQVEGTSNFFAEGVLVHNCNLLIIDDPIKNREEAESSTQRDKVWDWFTSTAMTRLTPGGTLLVVHTRWHPDDLIGRLRKKGGWTVINLPAVDDHGSALWPQGGWTADVLKKRREEVGEYDWSSLYMGDPRPRGGRLFEEPTFYEKPNVLGQAKVIISCDPAATAKTHADYSVIVVGSCWMDSSGLPAIDILDVQRMQVEIPSLVYRLAHEQRKWKAPIVVEAVGGFKAVPQSLRAMLRGVRIIEVTPSLDKFVRALPTSAAWNAGRIRLPGKLGVSGVLEADPSKPWIGAFLDEAGSFTGIADDYDDQVDALAHLYNAAHQMLGGRGSAPAPEIARYMPFG